ncbi:MAG TPA: PVC-type heme-binding CxxCH protein [Planctomycetaceae bacterium]|nr:PVC-type heme-binding CxxCH protein [Planctomycetaceae bacterium]
MTASAVLMGLAAFHLANAPISSFGADGKPAATAAPPLADELPRIPPVEPADALGTFTLQHGFRLELVAHEPAVSDPVDACFDENGRMYVAEMHGYPFSHEPRAQQPQGGGKKNAGIIRLLEDTDDDGVFDRSVVFAKDISWPTSVCCYDGGVFVLAPEHLYYFKDTDGDDVADVREIVYSGFSRANVQGLANNLKWGLDNRIYGAGGTNSAELTHRGEKLFALGSRDFCFDPRTEKLEAVSGGLQFGHSFDDWGNRFVCSNSNHILHVVFEERYFARNPYFAAPAVARSIAKEGAAAPVFRQSPPEPWRIVRTRRRASDPDYRKRLPPTELVATGFFTSATGVTIYRGGAYPADFRGNAFIGDVGGNLVHRKRLEPAGASFAAVRADESTEFLTSTDNWFRPVNFVNAPDGTLYILDMYRETIEHPVSIPEDIKAHLDLESGDDRGRIYRLVPPGFERTPPPKLGRASAAELVAALDSPNGWNRETAQRLLWERQDGEAVALLEAMVLGRRAGSTPLGRLHALSSLDGLEALSERVLLAALSDGHAGVRAHAIRLAEPQAHASEKLTKRLLEMAERERDDRVRMQLAYSLGEVPSVRLAGLAALARSIGSDRDLRTAWLTSTADVAGALAEQLLGDESFAGSSSGTALLAELARMAGAHKDPQAAVSILAAVTAIEGRLPLKRLVVGGVGDSLGRRGVSFRSLLSAQPHGETRARVESLFKTAAATADDDGQPLSERQAAAALLAYADDEDSRGVLAGLLDPTAPPPLQTAAVRALDGRTEPAVSDVLLDGWRSYSPQLRRDVVDALVSRAERVAALLDAVAAGAIQPGEIERDKKELLANHRNTSIRDRARAVFAAGVSADRAQAVAAYQSVLDRHGDLERGRDVYAKRCAQCHKVGETGHQVGPDLASTSNKSPADLLIAILDPNREAQPNYTAYSVATLEGKLLNGIIVAETATSLTLRRAEGKEDTVLRSEIDELSSTGKSLMPDGLEQDISPEQMADLLAFVKTITPAPSE